jgi:hypothetical protein
VPSTLRRRRSGSGVPPSTVEASEAAPRNPFLRPQRPREDCDGPHAGTEHGESLLPTSGIPPSPWF